uniref:Uncharacterized protein n=1 Tax=Arundo donax TaxID=35708 RepID=A0A0A9B0L1_ARUDO
MDIHIWYTLLSALVGGVMGARDRLGEIRSIEMLHKRFESFPEAFAKNLSPQRYLFLILFLFYAAGYLADQLLRIQKLLRCTPRFFPRFGMRLSRACVRRTMSATGKWICL